MTRLAVTGLLALLPLVSPAHAHRYARAIVEPIPVVCRYVAIRHSGPPTAFKIVQRCCPVPAREPYVVVRARG